MKVLIEIIIISLLIIIGWRQPFREHAARIVPGARFTDSTGARPATLQARQALRNTPVAPVSPPVPRQAALPQEQPVRDASWLWKHKSLDPAHR